MKKITVLTISLILALSFCFDASFVWATPLSELQEQIEQKQDELKAGQKKEKDLSNKVNELEETIYELNLLKGADDVIVEKLSAVKGVLSINLVAGNEEI